MSNLNSDYDMFVRRVVEAYSFIEDEDPDISTECLLSMTAERAGCRYDEVIDVMTSESPILAEYGYSNQETSR